MVLHTFGQGGQGVKARFDLALAQAIVAGGHEYATARLAVVDNELRVANDPELENWVAFIVEAPRSVLPKTPPTEQVLFIGREEVRGYMIDASSTSLVFITSRLFDREPAERPGIEEHYLCAILRNEAVWHPRHADAQHELHAL